MNKVAQALKAFDGLKPWEGPVPLGYLADFMGVLIDLRFRERLGVVPADHGGGYERRELPTLNTYHEGFFEVLEWVEAARAARGSYVMISLGACFGYQAVGCYKALQAINPMPAKLVLVEPEPGNVKWIHKHLRDNGIDPEAHWIVPMAVSDNNEPALFPVGSPGTGTHNMISTNHIDVRKYFLASAIENGTVESMLRNLLLRNTTGLTRDISGNQGHFAEVKYVSCVTIADILGPFDRVDYIEADIQIAETVAFAPFMDVLKRKVKRLHIGTHGEQAHEMMTELFADAGWDVVFNFAPFKIHETDAGSFRADDGILSLRNPDL
jgi:hypothetical protein